VIAGVPADRAIPAVTPSGIPAAYVNVAEAFEVLVPPVIALVVTTETLNTYVCPGTIGCAVGVASVGVFNVPAVLNPAIVQVVVPRTTVVPACSAVTGAKQDIAFEAVAGTAATVYVFEV
jgi:hypothetical protein